MQNTTLETKLAREGGPAVRTAPFAQWPVFDNEMIDAVTAVLQSGRVNYWTGDEVRLFEDEFACYVNANHAVAVANGTLALELALHALQVGPGDEVIVPSRTFIASASCVAMRGARPVVADIDPLTQNVNAATIEEVISPRTKAVIAVHLAGCPCDMDPINDLARQHGIYVVEDCAQAHGATYKGRAVGSLGDVAAFSFCQDKIMTTGGEGGMLTTNDHEIWRRAWSHKDHGKSWDAVHRESQGEIFRWLHESFGTNWRMTEMQAAIGRVALKRLPAWVERRRANASCLNQGLSELRGLRVVEPPAEVRHSYYKHYAFLELDKLHAAWSRDEFVRALQAEGIPCGSGACAEIHRELAFTKSGLGPEKRPLNAQRLGESSLMFQVHPTLSDADMHDTCRAVKKVLSQASIDGAPAAPRAA